jgi:hypothetical protein
MSKTHETIISNAINKTVKPLLEKELYQKPEARGYIREYIDMSQITQILNCIEQEFWRNDNF